MIRDIWEYILSLLKSRIVPLALAFIVLFSVLINRLFSLQIVNGESYAEDITDSIQKEMSVTATRGRIFDRNGVLLAYNDLAYAVKISDNGTYTDSTVKNDTINNAIEQTLNIIEQKGDEFTNDLPITYLGDDNYAFTYDSSSTSLIRFLRDSYGVDTIANMTDEQKNSTANELIDYFCETYEINKDDYTPEHMLEIINLRRYMSANTYNKYLTFTIANEVSDETVAAILENSDELVGVTVEEQYIRRYVNSVYCSQVIGYTGTVSTSQLEELQEIDSSYEANDVVGKSGIEEAMEQYLSGTKGTKEVYLDTYGRITEVTGETDATAGDDVYLTIDINLQTQIYEAIEDELVDILLTYITTGTTKYTETSSGSTTVNILITEVYNALINNNLVSLDEIATAEEGTTGADVYSAFLTKQATIMDWIQSELTDDPTAYGSLTDEEQVYIWYIYNDILKSDGLLDTDAIDTSDEVYTEWVDGDSVSLEEFITHAISQGWIDMSELSNDQYSSLNESYEILVDYIMTELSTDQSFYKKLYKYMIDEGSISGRQVCMLLFEQGFLTDESQYNSLSSGSLDAYTFMYNAISTKEITPAQLALQPCSGSAVITNPNTGDIEALVSYPSYDNNKLSGTVDSDYYYQLYNDNSSPLLNWATQSLHAPGSTFKPCTAIAALDIGLITTSTTYYCSGTFTEVTPSPQCWLHSGHGTMNVVSAIKNSCNVFFYNVGYQLALSKNGSYNSDYATNILKSYAEQLGLATKSGIEIAESEPSASSTNAIASAIGQGNHAYSTVNLARYVTTLANSGTVYNLTLVDKVTDQDGNLIYDNSAEVANQVEISDSIWTAVHEGMIEAGESYSALSSLGYKIAGKSGTAQEKTTEPDHSLLITYAPYDDPEVAMAVSISNGYTSSTSCTLTAEIYKIYYSLKDSE